MLTLTLTSFGETKCDNALKACDDVIKAQDQAIVNLKKTVENLNEQLAEKDNGVKWWQALVAGIVIGAIVTKVNK